MQRRRTPLGVRWVILIVMSACAACTTAAEITPGIAEPARGTVVISAGNTTGVYYAWSQQLAEQLRVTNPRLKVQVNRSGGSIDNLQRLRDGTADLALTTVDATESTARADLSPTATDVQDAASALRVPLQALGRIYDDYVQVVVRADSELRSVADLAGKRVAVGEPGSGVALIADRVLQAASISVAERDLGVADGMTALNRREIDAVFWSGGSRRPRSPQRPRSPSCACCRSAIWPPPCARPTARCTGRPRFRPAATPAPRRSPPWPRRTCWWPGPTRTRC